MEIRFESDLEYQLQAIASVVGLFEGQAKSDVELILSEAGFAAVSNRLDLDEETLLENLRSVQADNEIPGDEALQLITATVETADGESQVRLPNFSIEMETGTGKTYAYLRTAVELYRSYGMRKFIVVVPSVAIREGVMKTLRMTERHLKEIYENPPYRFYPYDSGNLNIVRQFALSDGVEIMVMTIDSFKGAATVIRQSTDWLQGETPLHLIQATRPILILDEPQNMESVLSVQALSDLDPLFALRYSATHKNPYNVAYRLTPFDAYRQELVKRIEVAGIQQEMDANQVFVRVEEIKPGKKTVKAKLTIHKLMANGTVKEKLVTVKGGDSLREKSGLPDYEDFAIDEIIPGVGVRFANDIEVPLGETRGADREAIFETQIRYTVEEHLRKQRRFREKGIKVLSLFFIDRVANYADEDGLIRVAFDRAFKELREPYEDWKDLAPAEVRRAYFAEKRRKGKTTELVDSTTGETKADEEAYDLIMRDKERLLSFDEPVSFIFSHSALREGWDNPNVFQICTLNQSVSERKKRQEVGRGVRLPVDQEGDRVRDPAINVLTVVANESYERYVEGLQKEIEEEYGKEALPPKPPNARKRGAARLRKEFMLRDDFKELWERIRQRTRYAVTVDTEALIADVVSDLDEAEVRPLRVSVRKGRLAVGAEDVFGAQGLTGDKTVLDLSGRHPLPNLVEVMSYLLEQSRPPVRLTRRTLAEIFRQSEKKGAALKNPHEWATVAVRIIKEKLADQLVAGILYERIDEWYEMTQLPVEIEGWEEYLVPAERALYDHIVFDSAVERRFVEALEARDDVKLYLKLPSWFKVATPVGAYNPDWAIVKEERDEHGDPVERIYLVAETKGTTQLAKLRPDEKRKILCGRKHFEDTLGVAYKVLTSTADI